MDRKELDGLLLDERYEGNATSENEVDDAAYAEAKSEFEALNSLLEFSEDEPPRPGFDTRFYAQLKDVQQTPEPEEANWLERLVWLLLPIGALVVVAMTISSSTDVFEAISSSRDMGLAMELELLEDYEIVRDLQEVEQDLDEVEHFEFIAQLNLGDLEGLEPFGDDADSEEVRIQ